jgi:diguanylate cyclase (GGDEF)-like protein
MIASNPIYNDEGNFIGVMGMLTDITEKKQIELTLNSTNCKLNEIVTQLEEYNQEFLLLNKLNDFLQACKTVQEAYKILPQFMEALFPSCNGALFRLNQINNQIEIVVKWGDICTLSSFNRSDCWGLRQNHFHYQGKNFVNVPCYHLLESCPCMESLCIPLMTDTQQTGLLFLGSSIGNILNTSKQQLAKTLTENISLILTNLELRETLEFQSVRDPLTNLFNRRYWEEALEREIKLAQRQKNTLTVVMVDVDFFKRFNDTFGHKAGDFVLQKIASLLQQHFRQTDLVCRYGGEEFLVILPDADLAYSQQRTESLRQTLGQLSLEDNGQQLGHLTASFGLASFPTYAQTSRELLQKADQALFLAKQQGRDRVIVYSSELILESLTEP